MYRAEVITIVVASRGWHTIKVHCTPLGNHSTSSEHTYLHTGGNCSVIYKELTIILCVVNLLYIIRLCNLVHSKLLIVTVLVFENATFISFLFSLSNCKC